VPKLDARPYVAEFFPSELWSTLGIEENGKGGDGEKKKKLLFSALDVLTVGDEEENDEEGGEEGVDGEGGKGKKKGLLAGLLGTEDDAGDDEDEEEGGEDEEEVEDDFGDDEEVGIIAIASCRVKAGLTGNRETTMRSNILMMAVMMGMTGEAMMEVERTTTRLTLKKGYLSCVLADCIMR
jgi:DNA-directed RNA polymerase III subunit Rpc31